MEDLKKDPKQGTALGDNCFKIRIAIASKGKGKSGGARVITHVLIKEETVFLLSIYDKAEREAISDKDIKEH
ncbi:type II toxin-antitoxin system RelE/ParE family toxin [Arcticibacter tournemirensis]|uniref:type II toxin-antitoxin system RelE/ParE family toxin n=1 Tax=Arcticibacter tournemirensis TaxID=699437 RepID=UPI0029391201|nr:type II toxin-antitoxin system RelE/ParE family toxin [Arcticibacter tournemirensis]